MVNKVDKVFWCIACEEFLDGMFLLSSILRLISPPSPSTKIMLGNDMSNDSQFLLNPILDQ